MPLEVNELGIFMRVMEKETEKDDSMEREEDCEGCVGFSKAEIVQDCVARVLEILEHRNQR
jgi:hypothetical protein